MTTAKEKNCVVMVLSPAKTMDLRPLLEREFDSDDVNADAIFRINARCDQGKCDAKKTNWVCAEMKEKKKADLKSLLGLSDKLANAAHEFWSNFAPDHAPSDADDDYRPAIFTFAGPAFKGLDAPTCNKKALSYLASNLFILDPVYGALPSLRGIQPYRLEMGCKLVTDKAKKESLAAYWRESVTRYLGMKLMKNSAEGSESKKEGKKKREEVPEPMNGHPVLVNLASEEYSSSIDPKALPRNTVYLSVVFRHKGRVLSVHAKRARGLMTRHMAECKASTLEDIAKFNSEGYECCRSVGKSYEILDRVGDNVYIARMIFDRDDAPRKETETKRAGSKKGGSKTKKAKRL